MDFDEIIERRGTHCMKWDMMAARCGVSAADAIPMWVADMDFRPPPAAGQAIERMLGNGIIGYHGDDESYRQAIIWWMGERHGWTVRPEWIFSTHGLVNGTALCIQAFTKPGDGVILFTPVYHAFARLLTAAERPITELPLINDGGRYRMDCDAYASHLTGRERLAILCSPHNPGGRVWSPEELRAVAAFCDRHDLILVADEIHNDLVMPGNHHTPMAIAAPHASERLVMMTAITKTFNLAGVHVGNVIIPDGELRRRFARCMAAMGISANSFGLFVAEAVYSPQGVAWLEDLIAYLDRNRRRFDAVVNAIPGARSMPLEATYLAWVDFAETGLPWVEIADRIENRARIAVNRGPTFGTGGESHMRFNLALPRRRLEDALARLDDAFADLRAGGVAVGAG